MVDTCRQNQSSLTLQNHVNVGTYLLAVSFQGVRNYGQNVNLQKYEKWNLELTR